MIIEETIKDASELRICYEGSGNPDEPHTIVGIRFKQNGEYLYIGDYEKMKYPDKLV